MKRFMNKKVATIGLAAGLALGAAGAAFAYFTTTGSGSGSTTAGTASAVTLHATIGGTSAIAPGDGGQPVTFTADNSNTGAQFVNTISFVSVTSTDSGCQTFLTANPGQFSMVAVTSNTDVPGSQTGYALNGTGTLKWADEAYAQNACAGKNLTLNVSSN